MICRSREALYKYKCVLGNYHRWENLGRVVDGVNWDKLSEKEAINEFRIVQAMS